MAAGQRFVDDRYMRSAGAILCRDCSSSSHLHAHRREVIGADEIDWSYRFSPRRKWRLPFDLKSHAKRRPGERKKRGQTGGVDSWQSLDAREQFLEIRPALWRCDRIFGVAG